jgi:hypothetical protein
VAAFSSLLLLSTLPASVLGGDVLETNGFSLCGAAADIQVQKLNLQFNKDTKEVVFDVAGTSSKSQEVTASLTVTAYGQQVYQKNFDPCDAATKVEQLCPGMKSPPSVYSDLANSLF